MAEAMESLCKISGTTDVSNKWSIGDLVVVIGHIKSMQQLLACEDIQHSKSSRHAASIAMDLFASAAAMLSLDMIENSTDSASIVPTLTATHNSNQILKEILTLAVCGWCYTEAHNTHNVSTPAHNIYVHCGICRRRIKISLQDGFADAVGPAGAVCIQAHRYFCPFVNSPVQFPHWATDSCGIEGAFSIDNLNPLKLKSYQLCALAFARAGGMSSRRAANAAARSTSLGSHRRNSDGNSISDCNGSTYNSSDHSITLNTSARREDDSHDLNDLPSPEQAYKRVRAVLDQVNM